MGGNRRGKKRGGEDPSAEKSPDVAENGRAIDAADYVSPIPAPESVIVCDPATKQRITLMWGDTQHTAGRAILLENLAEGRKKESYLCMLFQKGMCRSHQRCNQVHADKVRVAELREEYFQAHGRHVQGQDEPLAHQRALEVVVVDPADDRSRITLPFAKTADTEGRREYFKTQQTRGGMLHDFRICPCFLTAVPTTCELGTRCPNIHADRSFVKHINEAKPCCPFHGDAQSKVTGFRGRLFMVNKNNQRCPVPLERVAATKGSRELFPASGQIIFACNRVCRLHQEKHCPWQSECANLHICREFYAVFANCAKPSLMSLPSQPGLQILPSGKLRPIPGTAAAAGLPATSSDGPSSLGPNPVSGVPLSPSAGVREAFAIPLVTSEGPVPRRLLPEQALRRYPSAGNQPEQHTPQGQPGWPVPGAAEGPKGMQGMQGGQADQMGFYMAAWMKMMQDAPQGQAAMAAMMEAYARMAGMQTPPTGMPGFPPFPHQQHAAPPSHTHNPHPVPERSQAAPPPRPTISDHSAGGTRSSPFSAEHAGRMAHAPVPADDEIPTSLRQVAYADSEPDDSEPEDASMGVPRAGSSGYQHPQGLPFTSSGASSLAPPPLAVASSALDAMHSSMSPAVSFGQPSGTAPGVPPPHAINYAAPQQPVQGGLDSSGRADGGYHSPVASYQSQPTQLQVSDSFRSRTGQHLPYGPPGV
eukprot:Hpha_TRINITY_DN16065_c2_g1::TRINITY_DN16065_c2_g1_i1::g.117253::m.117253